MTRSITNSPQRLRAALTLTKLSVPKIAQRHGVPDKTLYAVISGARPGRDPKVQAAVKEMEQLAEKAFRTLAHA